MIKMLPIAKTKQLDFVVKDKYSFIMKFSGTLKGVRKSEEMTYEIDNTTN